MELEAYEQVIGIGGALFMWLWWMVFFVLAATWMVLWMKGYYKKWRYVQYIIVCATMVVYYKFLEGAFKQMIAMAPGP